MKELEMQDKAKTKPLDLGTHFDVTKHIRLFPQFQEKEVDKYFLPIEQELPDLYPSCAVTRAMAKKAILTENQSDVDLTDSFIGQSFKNEIARSLCHNLPEYQTDSDDSISISDHFTSSLVEEGHDIRSRSQLSEEQHKDPEISSLFHKADNETDLAQDPICFYIKNGILMRKWRSPEVSADDEWPVNHQIVLSKIYRFEILSLAHETLCQVT